MAAYIEREAQAMKQFFFVNGSFIIYCKLCYLVCICNSDLQFVYACDKMSKSIHIRMESSQTKLKDKFQVQYSI